VQSVDRVDAGLIGYRSISAGHLFIVTGKEFGVTSLSSVSSKDKYPSEHGSDAIDEFPTVIRGFLKEHRPSRMPFFRHLANLPFSVASDRIEPATLCRDGGTFGGRDKGGRTE